MCEKKTMQLQVILIISALHIVLAVPIQHEDQIAQESEFDVSSADQSEQSSSGDNGVLNSAIDLGANLLSPPVKTREFAKLESEQFPSKVLSIYDDKHFSTAQRTKDIQPVIDVITEEEKYGNNGDKFLGIGRLLVNGYEVFANFMNKVLNAPGEVAKSISKTVTDKLNVIGGKLVGLD